MNLELGNPAGLWALTLIAPLVLLYLLRIRRRRVAVAAAWLWRAAEQDLRARAPLRRLTPQTSLFLQCLALALLAFALADPSARASGVAGDHLAIVIDSGASMAARGPGQPTRFDLATSKAKELIENLPAGADAMIIQAGRAPHVVSGLLRDRRRLITAIEAVQLRHEPSAIEPAVSVAFERLSRLAGSSRVVVVGDAATDTPAVPANGPSLELLRVGGTVANVGLTRLDVRRARTADRDRVEVFATVRNFGPERTSRFVTLRRRNSAQAIASRQLSLEPGEQAPAVLSFAPAATDPGTGLVVELSPEDGFGVDDRAFGIVPPGPHLRAYLSPPGADPWVARALTADPAVELLEVTPEEHRSVGIENAFNVFSGYCPERAPPTDVLVVNPPRGRCVTIDVGEELDNPLVTSWATEDPRMRFLTLEGLSIRRARSIQLSGPRGSLLRAGTHTLVADMDLVGRTGTLVAFDLGQSDWPLQASFVLFIRNLTERARTAHSLRAPGVVDQDGSVSLRVPLDVTEIQVQGPDGFSSTFPAREGLASVPPPARTGHYLASWKGDRPGSVLFSMNLTDVRESAVNHAPASTDADGSRAEQAAGSSVKTLRPWGWLAALLALAVLLAELLWETRLPAPIRLDSAGARSRGGPVRRSR